MVAEYALPELPYDYSALEPYISGQIMELHHSKHHLAYVKGVNTAVEQLAEARSQESFANVNGLEKNLSFHLGGHVNHSVFWPNMSPEGGDKPTGDLAAAIDEWFGSFDAFRTHFQANALAIQGSGWSILAWDVLGQRLHIAQLYDQQSNLPACLVPLLMLDMWEHAYYLQYLNDKASFVKEWWHVANWADVDARFQRARSPDAGADRPVSLSEGRRAEMLRLIEDAQRVAGIVAARDRGDKAGATELISAFDDEGSMAQGSLLLTEMLLQLHHARTGQDVQETLRELTIQLEASVRAA